MNLSVGYSLTVRFVSPEWLICCLILRGVFVILSCHHFACSGRIISDFNYCVYPVFQSVPTGYGNIVWLYGNDDCFGRG